MADCWMHFMYVLYFYLIKSEKDMMDVVLRGDKGHRCLNICMNQKTDR